MNSIVVIPKRKSEFKLISELLRKLNIPSKVISVEEAEDLGLSRLLKNVNRTLKVSRNHIMKKLRF